MSKELDINFYKYIYDDVKYINSEKELIFHYNNYGIKECRIPNKQFFYEKFKYYNYEKYIKRHIELEDKTEEDAIHFFIYNDYVDPIFYKYIYPEVINYDSMQCRHHYFTYGVDQNRLRNYNHFLEIYENTIDIKRIKKIFNIEYNYVFVKFFLDNFNNVDFFYKEYYFYFLKRDYFNYSFLDMLNNNLLDNFNIFYKKYNNFNLEEYKISCGLKFNYDIQYYIQYIRDDEIIRDK
jgi:hypothetical protein